MINIRTKVQNIQQEALFFFSMREPIVPSYIQFTVNILVVMGLRVYAKITISPPPYCV